jgi:hypothetical protein
MADYRTSKEPGVGHKPIPGGREYVNHNYQDTPNNVKPLEDEAYAKARKANAENQFMQDVSLIFTELEDLLLSKHKDYGPKNISQSPGGPLNGLRVRLWDKLARLNNLTDKNSLPQHESLEDTFKDMANYAVIGLLVLRDKWDK